ncbi:uncharacterized protein RSE6_07665 [Rhynchosporium secalis]|uniref:Uncharacterized protein n=1 Tax=Rhynchosporium secalis TaxID=38038 RepID=A0A1E1MEI2_RHYSE|nr:uncharacterized protein RSE6_07665 [Rhynchosporium secalis]
MSGTEPTPSSSPTSTFEPKTGLNIVSTKTAPPASPSATSNAAIKQNSIIGFLKDANVTADSSTGSQVIPSEFHPDSKCEPVQSTANSSPRIESKTEPDNNPLEPKRVKSNLIAAVKEAVVTVAKVNSNSSHTVSINEHGKTLPYHFSDSKSPKVDVSFNPEKSSAANIPNVSKATPKIDEGASPNTASFDNFKKYSIIQTRKSPQSNPALSNNSGSSTKTLSELQADCRARDISTYGTLAELARRVSRSDQREVQFALDVAKQEREFAKDASEREKNQETATGNYEHENQQGKSAEEKAGVNVKAATSPDHFISSSSSHASDSRPPKNKPQLAPAIWEDKSAPRHLSDAGTKVRSSTIPHGISATVKPFTPQDITFQKNDIHKLSTTESTRPFGPQESEFQKNSTRTKPENVKPTRTFASQDVRLDTNYMLSHGGSATIRKSSNIQGFGSRKVTLPATQQDEMIALASPPQVERRRQEHKPANADTTKIAKASSAASLANVVIVKTDREMDKINFLHKHTWEVQQELGRRGIGTRCSRKTMITRFFDQHLKNLRAEFIQARDTYAKKSANDPDASLQKDILWYRLERFEEHRRNQIGQAGEPHRQASYIAAKECKYASPRHAKIMGDKLAELLAQEKQSEKDKIKNEVKPVDVSKGTAVFIKKMGDGVKLEPCKW